MRLLLRIKFKILQKLGNSLGLPNLDLRLHHLSRRAPIADARLDSLEAALREVKDAAVLIRRHEKLTDLYFQTVFDCFEDEGLTFSSFRKDLDERLTGLHEHYRSLDERLSRELSQAGSGQEQRIDALKAGFAAELARIADTLEDLGKQIAKLDKQGRDADGRSTREIGRIAKVLAQEHKRIRGLEKRELASEEIGPRVDAVGEQLASVVERVGEQDQLVAQLDEIRRELDAVKQSIETREGVGEADATKLALLEDNFSLLDGRLALIRMLLFETVEKAPYGYVRFSDLEG